MGLKHESAVLFVPLEKNIEVEITYCDQDIRQAIAYTINRRNKAWVAFPCVLIVILGIFIYGFLNGFSQKVNGLMIIYLICALVYYLIYYKIPTDRYIDFYRKKKGGTYTFSQQEIKAVGEEIQSIVAWSVFKKAYEVPSAFVLEDENRFLHIFPKRLFPSEADIDELRQMIVEKISDFKRY